MYKYTSELRADELGINDKNVSSREDTFLSWHLAPASEVGGVHTLPV
jgi:hypothetical protein